MGNLLIFLIGRGVVLGFSAASVPGPLQGYVINTAVQQGWRRAALITFSPLIVDIPIILAVLLALESLEAFVPRMIDIIRIVGGLFVFYLAWGALKDFQSRQTWQSDAAPPAQETARATLGRGMILNLVSPGPYLFWTTVNGPLLKQGLDASPLHGAAFLVAFYGTFLSGLMGLAALVSWLGQLNERFARGILLATALLLVGMGVWLLYDGVLALI